jgi:quercetin 2,3-dioxygenase
MTTPAYTGLQKKDIPVTSWDDGKVTAQVVSGNWNGVQGAIQSLTDISLACLHFKKGGKVSFNIPVSQTVFLYVVKGHLTINNEAVRLHHLVDFEHNDEVLQIEATTDALILLGYATPFYEPFIAHGPFVMNTKEEIMQAYDDYNKGKFGDATTLLD